MNFSLINLYLLAHEWAHSLLKIREVDVAFFLWVQHRVHQCNDFSFTRVHLVLGQMLLEVLVRNETVLVMVDFCEKFEFFWL